LFPAVGDILVYLVDEFYIQRLKVQLRSQMHWLFDQMTSIVVVNNQQLCNTDFKDP